MGAARRRIELPRVLGGARPSTYGVVICVSSGPAARSASASGRPQTDRTTGRGRIERAMSGRSGPLNSPAREARRVPLGREGIRAHARNSPAACRPTTPCDGPRPLAHAQPERAPRCTEGDEPDPLLGRDRPSMRSMPESHCAIRAESVRMSQMRSGEDAMRLVTSYPLPLSRRRTPPRHRMRHDS